MSDVDRYKDKNRRRAYMAKWHREHRVKKPRDSSILDYPYKVVPKTWKNLVSKNFRTPTIKTEDFDSPIVRDLLHGNICYVDYEMGMGRNHPYKGLYGYFTRRGLRLRVYTVDRPESNEYRRLLMWCEPFEFEEVS